MTMRRECGSTTRGFTLIELLVVVAIILLLIGLLVPFIAGAIRKSRETETRHQLEAIGNAIDAYQVVFNAYPGPVAERDLPVNNVIGTQNMIIGLMGNIATSAISADSGQQTPYMTGSVALGGSVNATVRFGDANGPRDLSDKIADPAGKLMNAFYVPKRGELAVISSVTNVDATIPVIYDRFGDPLPVLYFRTVTVISDVTAANASTTERRVAYADATGLPSVSGAPVTGNTRLYWRAFLQSPNNVILQSTTLQSLGGTVYSQATSGFATANQTTALPVVRQIATLYNTHFESAVDNDSVLVLPPGTAAPTTAQINAARASKQPGGGYVLMSAGSDRIYGPVISGSGASAKRKDADDIVRFGP